MLRQGPYQIEELVSHGPSYLSDMVEAVEHPSVRSLGSRLGRFRGPKHVPEPEGLVRSS
jgi:hypothetical protein